MTKRYNPELSVWRGRSYRKGGLRVRLLRLKSLDKSNQKDTP